MTKNSGVKIWSDTVSTRPHRWIEVDVGHIWVNLLYRLLHIFSPDDSPGFLSQGCKKIRSGFRNKLDVPGVACLVSQFSKFGEVYLRLRVHFLDFSKIFDTKVGCPLLPQLLFCKTYP